MKAAEIEKDKEHERRARLHSRIRMAKQILRPLPRRANLHRWPVLKWFAQSARKRPYLWTFRVREVSIAIYLGSIIAFLPIIGFQIVIALFSAFIVRANLPVIVGVQLVTNPITAAFIYGFTGYVGHLLVDLWSLPWFDTGIARLAYDLIVGGVVVGLAFGFALDLLYRLFFAPRLGKKVNVRRLLKT